MCSPWQESAAYASLALVNRADAQARAQQRTGLGAMDGLGSCASGGCLRLEIATWPPIIPPSACGGRVPQWLHPAIGAMFRRRGT
jgi:hypothetical protein